MTILGHYLRYDLYLLLWTLEGLDLCILSVVIYVQYLFPVTEMCFIHFSDIEESLQPVDRKVNGILKISEFVVNL